MNISKTDVKRLVLASRTMDEAINRAIAYKETIDEIIKKVVEKDGTLNYMYEEYDTTGRFCCVVKKHRINKG